MGTYVIMKENQGIFKKGLIYKCRDFSIETSDKANYTRITKEKAEIFKGVAYKCLQVVGDPAIKVGNIYPEDHKDLWIWQKDWTEYFEKIDCRNGNKEEEVSLKTGYVIAKRDSVIKECVFKGQVYPAEADGENLIKLMLPNGSYYQVTEKGAGALVEDFEGVAYKCTAPDGEYVNFKHGEIYPEDFKLNDHTDEVKGIAEVCPEEWEKIDCSPKKKKQADFIKATVSWDSEVRNLAKALSRFKSGTPNRSEVRENPLSDNRAKKIVDSLLYSSDPAEAFCHLAKLGFSVEDIKKGSDLFDKESVPNWAEISKRKVEVPEFNEEGVPKGHSDFKGRVSAQLDIIKEMLIEKNRKYGNSALEPIRVFSKASAIEQIKVRLDDKLSRLKTQDIEEDEDVLQDLIGYLVLLRMAIINEPSKRGKGH